MTSTHFFEGDHEMTWPRSVLVFLLGVSPFAAIIALAQNAHFHDRLPEPLVAWFFHVNTLTIAFAGLLGGMADVILNRPKNFHDVAARVFFSVISSIMLIPALVDYFAKDISISLLMAFSFLASMSAQRLVPVVLKRFETQLETVMVEKKTKTIVEQTEVQKAPTPKE